MWRVPVPCRCALPPCREFRINFAFPLSSCALLGRAVAACRIACARARAFAVGTPSLGFFSRLCPRLFNTGGQQHRAVPGCVRGGRCHYARLGWRRSSLCFLPIFALQRPDLVVWRAPPLCPTLTKCGPRWSTWGPDGLGPCPWPSPWPSLSPSRTNSRASLSSTESWGQRSVKGGVRARLSP